MHRLWYAAAAVVAIVLICWGLWYHGMDHGIGIDTQTSLEYAYFSGFGAWLSSTLGLSSIVAAVVLHLNCHAPQCPRVGRYPIAGGQYKVCRRHHPDPEIREGRAILAHMHHKHREHAGR